MGVERLELHELRGDLIESSTNFCVGREPLDRSLVGAKQTPDDQEVLIG